MNRTMRAVLGAAAAATLALTASACVSDEGSDVEEAPFPTGPVTLTLAGWSFADTPEFATLAEGFEALHDNVTVELVEYAAGNDYDTQIVTDLVAGTAPDVYIIKNLKNYYTFQENGQLKDVSDIAAALPEGTGGLDYYAIDGKTYAVPYRQDSWVLYYNKDLFDLAGVDYPDGSWTWDDYAEVAKELTTNLRAAGSAAFGTYQHSWQSTVQGFALAQTPGAAIEEGDFGWAESYYDRVLDLQVSGAQQPLAAIGTTLQGGYQVRFGAQEAAMLPMGTWFVGTLINGQGNGNYQDFEWGFAPAPQYDESTTGIDNVPVTFGDPTGMGINGSIEDADRFTVAKEFLRYAAGVEGGKALAAIGITPANTTDEVAEIYFGESGAPNDDLSVFAWSVHDTKPENPVGPLTAELQNLLNQAHTTILNEQASVPDAIAAAEAAAKADVLS